MSASVNAVLREALRYTAACVAGKTFVFSGEENETVVKTAAAVSGLTEKKQDTGALESIFSCLRPDAEKAYVAGNEEGMFDGFSSSPGKTSAVNQDKWEKESVIIPDGEEFAQAYLELFEDCFSTVPSGIPAVSAYHMGKVTAALAGCLAAGKQENADMEKPFALYSIDFSGIQSFIYTIIAAGALKALRTRSLYLSVMTEHVSDLILGECGLPRTNLIYAGGGRAPVGEDTVAGLQRRDGAVAESQGAVCVGILEDSA